MTLKTTTSAAPTVAVLGYGSQGRVDALNLRDSGCNVVVRVRDGGGTIERARDDGFTPTSVAAAVAVAEVAAVLVPDMAQPTAAGASALRRQQRGDPRYRGLTDRSV